MRAFKLIPVLALCATAAVPLRAKEAAEGMPYLALPPGARSAALGGACGAIAGDMESAWLNPSSLAGLSKAQLSLTYLSWVGDVNGMFLLAGAPVGGGFSLGGAFLRDAARDTYRNDMGQEYGTFSVSDSVLHAMAAYRRGSWRVGAGAKWAGETVEKRSGSGFLADFGVGTEWLKGHGSLGASVQNLGIAPDLGAGRARTPVVYRAGSAFQNLLLPGLTLTQEYRYHVVLGEGFAAFGAQFGRGQASGAYALRAGYDLQPRHLGGASGFSAGAGITWSGLRLDYMFAPYSLLGAAHRVTVGWEFSAPRKKPSGGDELRAVPPSPVEEAAPAAEGSMLLDNLSGEADSEPETEAKPEYDGVYPEKMGEAGTPEAGKPEDTAVSKDLPKESAAATPTAVLMDVELEYIRQ